MNACTDLIITAYFKYYNVTILKLQVTILLVNVTTTYKC